MKLSKFFGWFFSPSVKMAVEDHTILYDKIAEFENRIAHLEKENIETTNVLYELHNRLDVIDVQQDMNTLKQFTLEK